MVASVSTLCWNLGTGICSTLQDASLPSIAGITLGRAFCKRCQGSGEVCIGEKTGFNKLGVFVTQKPAEFAGSFRRQRERGVYTVVGVTCADCRGAGLRVKSGADR